MAIVGGFLVSRVVSLSAERQGLERRARDLEEQVEAQGDRLEEARQRRQDVSWEFFMIQAAESCASIYVGQGSLSPEQVADSYSVPGVPTREDMLELASRLIQTIEQAFEYFERGGGTSGVPVEDVNVYEVVYNIQCAPSVWIAGDIGGERRAERYEKRIEDEREQQVRLSVLERERDFVRTEAARVAPPEGLWLEMAAFSYLTVVGVVFPVIGLASRPVPYDLIARRVYVYLFLSGLVSVGGYLTWAIRRLNTGDSRESD